MNIAAAKLLMCIGAIAIGAVSSIIVNKFI